MCAGGCWDGGVPAGEFPALDGATTTAETGDLRAGALLVALDPAVVVVVPAVAVVEGAATCLVDDAGVPVAAVGTCAMLECACGCA